MYPLNIFDEIAIMGEDKFDFWKYHSMLLAPKRDCPLNMPIGVPSTKD